MHSLLLTSLLFLLSANLVWAQEAPETSTPSAAPATQTPRLKMSWYRPSFQGGGANGKVRTILSGRTTPGTQIDFGAEEISVLQKGGEVQSVKASDLKVSEESVTADANGYFEMILDLPQGGVQLPIKIATDGQSKSYQINLEVKDQSVVMKSKAKLAESPSLSNRGYVWGGIGYNYVNMKQTSSAAAVDVAFESFRAPAIFLEGYFPVGPRWGVIGSYKKTPGGVGSPEGLTVENGNYSWDILTIEGRYSDFDWKKKFFERSARYYIRFGVSEHSVPFWARTSVTTVDILTNKVLIASVGGQVDYDYSQKWVFTAMSRFSYPVSSGSLMTVEPQFSFDGSLGAYYKFNNRWNVGGFWYGQYHSWNYKHLDRPTGQEVSGSQALLFSNMEARLGYSF